VVETTQRVVEPVETTLSDIHTDDHSGIASGLPGF
jgi:hypothetical protein